MEKILTETPQVMLISLKSCPKGDGKELYNSQESSIDATFKIKPQRERQKEALLLLRSNASGVSQ
ncbi:hypothetical protein [Methanocaldococcus sp.]